MRMKWMLTVFVLFGMAALTAAAAEPQAGSTTKEQAGILSGGQIDIGASGFATFTSSSTGLGVVQTPTDSYGGMLEVRHIVSPLVGYEFAFSFNPNDQNYAPKTGACGLVCQNAPTYITANQANFGINYVASYKTGNLRPFIIGGLGFMVTIPGAAKYGNNTSVRPAFNYGGGLDYNLGAHLGIRAQYRGSFYHAPNISSIYPSTGDMTQISMPMGGVFYRF